MINGETTEMSEMLLIEVVIPFYPAFSTQINKFGKSLLPGLLNVVSVLMRFPVDCLDVTPRDSAGKSDYLCNGIVSLVSSSLLICSSLLLSPGSSLVFVRLCPDAVSQGLGKFGDRLLVLGFIFDHVYK